MAEVTTGIYALSHARECTMTVKTETKKKKKNGGIKWKERQLNVLEKVIVPQIFHDKILIDFVESIGKDTNVTTARDGDDDNEDDNEDVASSRRSLMAVIHEPDSMIRKMIRNDNKNGLNVALKTTTLGSQHRNAVLMAIQPECVHRFFVYSHDVTLMPH